MTFFSLSNRSADRPVGVSDRSDDRSAESYCNAVCAVSLRKKVSKSGFSSFLRGITNLEVTKVAKGIEGAFR